MSFNFCGNRNMILFLENILKRKRLSHAYLFYGEEGVGKKTIARQFAQAIFCEKTNKPCMECKSCRKFLSKNHPDYFEIGFDSSKSKQGFSVGEARKLIEDSYIKPNDGLYKIYLLKSADTLLPSCANTLLKTLEEPPKHVIFLLISNSKEGVLETISSRCVMIRVNSIEDEICFNELKRRFPSEREDKLKLISNLCNGSMGKAIFYLKTDMGKEVLLISKNLVRAYFNRNELMFLQAVSKLEENVELSLEVFGCFLSRVKQILNNKIKKNCGLNFSFLNNIDGLFKCFERNKKILLYNGNKKLTISRLCAEIFQKKI